MQMSIDGLVQDCSDPSANALELPQSCNEAINIYVPPKQLKN